MKTYRITIRQEFGWAITRVQAPTVLVAVAKATARLYDAEDGAITKVEYEVMD
jgi:hypothetical protein